MRKYKIAFFAPNLSPAMPSLLRKIADSSDLKVYILCDYGIVPTKHKEFNNKVIKWDDDFLQGYSYELLKNYGSGVTNSGFFGLINPILIPKILLGDFDVVIVSGYARLSSWLIVIASWIKRTPILFIGESTHTEEIEKSKSIRFIKSIALGKIFFGMIDRFLSLGTDNKKFYELYGIPESHIFFSPYSVNDEALIARAEKLKTQKHALRESMGIEYDDFVIIFCGKLLSRKDPLTLVKAYENIHKDYPSSLIFVGEGELRGKIEDYANEKSLNKVKVVGFTDYEDIFNYYTIADLLVMPSIREPWATVVMEAMYFGLPVIVSDAVGSRLDWVKDNGFIFHVGDVGELSEEIKLLAGNRTMAKQFGGRSREIISKFSETNRVKGIIDAIDSLEL